MDRRTSLRSLILGGIGSSALLTQSCKQPSVEDLDTSSKSVLQSYGRTPEEAKRDAKLLAKGKFFNEQQTKLVATLCDIIVPADELGPAASEVGTVEFIDFFMWDIPSLQTPMVGGLSWITYQSLKRYNTPFEEATKEQQLSIIDDIAYPYDVEPEMEQGASFFSLFRNLVGTGYFTSKEGIQDVLKYEGNKPNVWDGVPDDELSKHQLSYEEERMDSYIKAADRGTIPTWDENKNLIG